MSLAIPLRRCGALALLSVALVSCGGGSDHSATTPVTASPTASVNPGLYTTAQSVVLSDTTSGAVIYYTLNGTTPTSASTQYSAAISISQSTILEAIAIAPGHSSSIVVGGGYTIGPAATAAGIWVGEDSEATPEEVLGFVLASGQAIFIRAGTTNAQIAQFSAGVAVAGTAFTSNLGGFANFPYTFADSSTSGSGTFDATLATETSLNGALTFSSTSNTAYNSTWTLSYSSLSLTGASLTAVAGSYTDASTTTDPIFGATIAVDANGVISTTTAATSGCSMSGQVTVTDPTTDIYQISYTLTGCTGAYVDLNSVALSGLAVLNSSVSPVQLLTGANTADGAATPYGLVLAFNRSSG